MNDTHFIEGPILPAWMQEQTSRVGAGQSSSTSATSNLPTNTPPDSSSTNAIPPNNAQPESTVSHATGAVASFQGIIRADHWQGQVVEAIEYSAYLPLAERLFTDMEQRIANLYKLEALRIWHSLGLVRAGECSMLVLAAAGHRAEAFDGLRAAVEAVKAEAPVWKRELFASGAYRWVEGPVSPLFEPAPLRTTEHNK
jgi:molybdopterin synthase catalytic subunit